MAIVWLSHAESFAWLYFVVAEWGCLRALMMSPPLSHPEAHPYDSPTPMTSWLSKTVTHSSGGFRSYRGWDGLDLLGALPLFESTYGQTYRLTCVDVNVSVANVNVDVDFNVSVYVCVLSVYTLVQQLVSHCCQTGPGFSPWIEVAFFTWCWKGSQLSTTAYLGDQSPIVDCQATLQCRQYSEVAENLCGHHGNYQWFLNTNPFLRQIIENDAPESEWLTPWTHHETCQGISQSRTKGRNLALAKTHLTLSTGDRCNTQRWKLPLVIRSWDRWIDVWFPFHDWRRWCEEYLLPRGPKEVQEFIATLLQAGWKPHPPGFADRFSQPKDAWEMMVPRCDLSCVPSLPLQVDYVQRVSKGVALGVTVQGTTSTTKHHGCFFLGAGARFKMASEIYQTIGDDIGGKRWKHMCINMKHDVLICFKGLKHV